MQKGIMITSNYRIVALDKLNVMVQKYSPSKEVVDKEGNKRVVDAKWDNYSYHPNIKQAIKSISDKELNIVVEAGANAVNRQFKKDETDFINCVAFGKTAETISQYLTKGRQIAIVGNIRTGSYDAQDGTKRYTTDVAVESFEFIGGKKQDSQNTPFDGGWGTGGDDITPVDDGDMPF